MSVVDDYTVEVPFTNFSIEWNSSMLNVFISGMEVFSKAAFDENGADWSRDNPVATGAFEVTDYRPDDLLQLLEKKHLLTSYQASVLRRGRTDGLVLGGYKLLYKNASGSFARQVGYPLILKPRDAAGAPRSAIRE